MNDVARLTRSSRAERAPAAPRTPAQGPRSRSRRRPQATQHYFAFLSYSHADEATAAWLHEALEQFRVPKRLVGKLTENGPIPRRLHPIFRDRGELAASGDLSEEIEEALVGSRYLIVLCSPAAVKSRWANAEIQTFKRFHPDGCIFAAIVDGEPFASEVPGREAEECFPPALRVRYDHRGRPTTKRAEPIAADLRPSGDGRQGGLLKIVAGMLGVGLDDLVQREGQRRQRKMQVIAAASLVGMLLTTGLSLTAIQSRDAARDQRREAEGLVAFMLGDLKDKLEPIGRLDALDGVGSRVLAYYSKQDASELSDEGLLQRSKALSLTARVAEARGNLKTAEQLYRQAMQGTAEAIRRNPGDPQRLFDHAQNVFYVGEVARDLGRIDQAEAAFREYKKLADRMVAIEPDNLKWRLEVAYADENIGIILYHQRRFAEASQQLRRAIGPMQSLAAIELTNAEYQTGLSNTLAWLADAQRDLGRLDAAIQLRQRQIAHLRGVLARGHRNVAFQQHLIPAHQALGLLFVVRGQSERAIEQFRRAVVVADRLISVEPENALWREFAAQGRIQLARTLLSLGRQAEAATETGAGCALVRQESVPDSSASSRRLRTDCLILRGRLTLQSAAAADALPLAKQAVASAKSERSEDPIRDRYRIASAYRLLGDVHRSAGDSAGARLAWTAGFAVLPGSGTERPAEMNERAEILKRLGRTADARTITAKLASIGYRSLN